MKASHRRVKEELRQLRVLNHTIRSAEQTRKMYEARLSILQRVPEDKQNKELIARLEELLDKLRVEKEIEKAAKIEEKYINALNQLSPLDRSIIKDACINGKAYWKIGQEIGYSERWIQDRVHKIIEQIVELLSRKTSF